MKLVRNSKVLLLVLGLMLVFSSVGFAEDSAPRVAIVFDVGGLGDQSFNDAAYVGLMRLQEELGADVRYVESRTPSDYEPNLSMLAREGYDVVWAIGFLLEDAVKKIAPQYPETRFGIIDSGFDEEVHATELQNVLGVLFKEHEGSFLVGVLAAETTKTGKVGFVGGIQIPVIERFEAGFKAGVWSVDPDIEIIGNYTGAFDDPAKGKAVTESMIRRGADVIFHAAGATGLGMIEACEEQGVWGIGVDSDQAHVAPNAVLNSMIKRVDVGVFEGTLMLLDPNFKGQTIALGLDVEGVGIVTGDTNNASPEAIAAALEWAERIASGDFVVPEFPSDVYKVINK
ncbi:MAG: BMP family ABC transporter substrate-binding protein [Firmicutes bacterium]|jgi:basic membrane protein A|nr:BMP family ABC transporter substrate-binding protein [Bacillota bacterium]NLO66746.1 BMP family ABC transporter substrate-binding protein [Bacillota bacterium]